MNLDHLNYFKTLVELKSRSAAAGHLAITPSTLSLALSKLEQEVGVPLIEKTRGTVELTTEGEAFYEYVNTALRFLNNGLKLIQEKRGGGSSKRDCYRRCFLGAEQRLVTHHQSFSTPNSWQCPDPGRATVYPLAC